MNQNVSYQAKSNLKIGLFDRPFHLTFSPSLNNVQDHMEEHASPVTHDQSHIVGDLAG